MQQKKLFFSAFLTAGLLITNINAQNIQINFTASGLSTTIDSIQVLNIAQGASVTVKSTESLQLVSTSAAIETSLPEQGNLRIFPNPMTETSAIEFFNYRECPVNIEVFDVTGKKVILEKQFLSQGKHKFEILGLNSGIYMVNVLTFDGIYTGKLLSNNENSGIPSIKYQSNNYLSAQESVLKSGQNSIQIPYNDGDCLLFRGMAGDYVRIVTLVPTENHTVNFDFIACKDAAGKNYAVVTIGSQTWMAENLALLLSVSPSSLGSQTVPHYYVYGYQGDNISHAKATSNYQTYGVLYNWPAALTACPAGWHLPTDEEWSALENYLISSGHNYDGTTTGNKIGKSMAKSSGWAPYLFKPGATGNTDYPAKRNLSGFSALPGGFRGSNYTLFDYVSYFGNWWSATQRSNSEAWLRQIYYDHFEVTRAYFVKDAGFSVRCLRNN